MPDRSEDGDTYGLGLGQELDEYIDWREQHPSDDLMTALLQAEFEDETGTLRRLTRQELLTYVGLVNAAGNETTTNLISWTGKVLAETPRSAQRAGREPLARSPTPSRSCCDSRRHRPSSPATAPLTANGTAGSSRRVRS